MRGLDKKSESQAVRPITMKGSGDRMFIMDGLSVRRQLEASGFIPEKEGCSVLTQSDVTACSSCVQ